MSSSSLFRRWFRWLFWSGTLLVGLVTLCIAVLRAPAVQTWIAKRIVAANPGWRLEAERIDLGPGGLEARGIDFSMPGINARSAPLAVRVQPASLLRRQLVVSQVDVDQLSIDLTPSRMESSTEPLAGILELLQAPLAWTVAKTSINARVDLREEGRSLATGDLRITGGGIKAGEPGVFNYEFSTASVFLPASPDNVIRSRGSVRIAQDGRNGIGAVELEGDLRLPRYGSVALPDGRLTLKLEKTASGETYRLEINFGDEARVEIVTGIAPKAAHATLDVTFAIQPALLSRIDPKLASFGALDGRVSTQVDLVSFAPSRSEVTVKSANSPFRFSLAQHEATRTARVLLNALPLSWANPWLADSGVTLTGGLLQGEWEVAAKDSGDIGIVSLKPVEIGPITITGEKLPPVLPITLRLSPRVSLAKGTINMEADDFTAVTEQGDRVDASFRLTHTPATARTQATGSLTGVLPTLLAGPATPLPFIATARWDVSIEKDIAQIDTLEFIARKDIASPPVVSLALQQSIRAGASLAALKTDPSQDLLRFAVNGLPLSWISRWLPDYAVNGTWAQGESTLRYSADGEGFVLATRLPWSFTDLEIATGGKVFFEGSAAFAPEFTFGDTLQSAELRSLHGEDASGNRLDGSAMFAWRPQAKTFATTLSLDASLPKLPHSEGAFGPITIAWRSRASTADGAVSQVEHLTLEVRNATGPLATVSAPQPALFARKPNGELILHTMEPLRVQTASVPLTWLRPWLPEGTDISGTLAATELQLHLEPQKIRLRPIKPLMLEKLSIAQDGETRVRDARVSFMPGMDLLVLHQLRPTFQLVFQGTAYATEGLLDAGEKRAVDFETFVGFIGNTEQVLPQTIDLQTRMDLAVLGAALDGSSRSGQLVARLNGNLLGPQPLDFWARLEGVKDSRQAELPPFEVGAHGQVDGRMREATFDVSIRHFTTPQAGDASFQLKLALDRDTLEFDSALRSRFVDLGAMLELVESFETPPKNAGSTPVPAGKSSAGNDAAATTPARDASRLAQLGVPFWSVLRGHFDLELGAVQFHPYRIDNMRGRLDLTESRLSLSGLTGTMFAGRWSGGLRIDYDPRAEADHFLTGGFHIEQFETARVVQTVFPNEFGSFEARINLDAAVRSDGNGLQELLNRAEGEFSIEGRDGVARLTHPSAGAASTLLVLGGAVSFSPELRALGRLLRKFAEMPVNELRVSGERDARGNIVLTEFRLDSPQARLVGRGNVPAAEDVALAGRPLTLGLELFARDEVGVILGNMKLLEKRPTEDGYRRMTQSFSVKGEVGRPDASPLYDLLAKGVLGSRGTWGLIMRKVQQEVEKQRAADLSPAEVKS